VRGRTAACDGAARTTRPQRASRPSPRSLDGLVDECARLVRDDALRTTICGAAEDYFDRYLALEQLGAYYVDVQWRTLQA
jgi:hypothetical protein